MNTTEAIQTCHWKSTHSQNWRLTNDGTQQRKEMTLDFSVSEQSRVISFYGFFLQIPLPVGRFPKGGIKLVPEGFAHDLQLLTKDAGAHQLCRIGGHHILHDPGPVLPGVDPGVGVHEAALCTAGGVSPLVEIFISMACQSSW